MKETIQYILEKSYSPTLDKWEECLWVGGPYSSFTDACNSAVKLMEDSSALTCIRVVEQKIQTTNKVLTEFIKNGN